MVTRFIEIKNPLDPWATMVVHDRELVGHTITDGLKSIFGDDFKEFAVTTVLYHNGLPIRRHEWDRPLAASDTVQIVSYPGDVVSLVIAIVAVIVAIIAIVMMPTPTTPGGTPQPDPVYTRSGQYNRSRPGEPIEVAYGRCRLYPSYGGRSYNLFYSNDQYQYNLFCLGQGHFALEELLIEDTPLSNFDEVQWELVPPGGALTLFRNNVITAPEVSGIELFGPNEEEYPDPDGWVGAFTVNAAGTLADRLEFDMTCPMGLFWGLDWGGLAEASVTFELARRLIDDDGNPLGAWVSFGTTVWTARSNRPQRKTYGYDVPAGRYEVRARRVSDKPSPSSKVTSTIQWTSVRGFLENVSSFGDVTMLAVKIRATNNINDNSRSMVNAIATRKLPIYTEEFGWRDEPEHLVATRNPIWAFCDILRAKYGGREMGRFIHLPQMLELAELFDEDNVTFDWIFEQKITLLDAITAVTRSVRGLPMMLGSRLGIVRDLPASIPTAVFGPDNIVAGSFTREFKFYDYDREDCVDLEYLDHDTWQKQTVRCALPGATQLNPKRVELPGITERNRAYREGMYIAAQDGLREQVTFRTGREGLIPTYGSLISVTHDLVRVGTSGTVLAMELGSLPSSTVLQLSDAVSFGEPEQEIPENPDTRDRVIVLRKRDATTGGPFVCTPGPTSDVSILPGVLYTAFSTEVLYFYAPVPVGTVLAIPVDDVFDYIRVTGNEMFEQLFDVGDPITLYRLSSVFLDNSLNVPPMLPPVIERPDPMPEVPVQAYRAHYFSVILGVGLDSDDYPIDDLRERPIFQFGVASRYAGFYKVIDVKPGRDEDVELTACIYDPTIYSYDLLDAPPLNSPPVPPPVPALPVATGLTVSLRPDDTTTLDVAWNPAYGAQNYVLQLSYDGVDWDEVANTVFTSATVSAVAGEVWLRVAAVNQGPGPWATWNGLVGVPLTLPAPPTGFASTAWVMDLLLTWNPQEFPSGGGFRLVLIDDDSEATLRDLQLSGEITDYTYSRAMAVSDGLSGRHLRAELSTGNLLGNGDPVPLVLTNALPAAATALTAGAPTGSSYPVSWTHAAPADFEQYRVYSSTTPGFTPGPGNLRYTGAATNTTLTGVTVDTYWRVGVRDLWTTEEVFSAEALIDLP